MNEPEKVTSSEYIEALFTNGYARERAFREWQNRMPFLKFDSAWEVSVVPPFMGAIARFMVRSDKNQVSIYFDAYDALGCMGQPYWELYPNSEGDTERFYLGEEVQMMAMIRELLSKERSNN